MFSGCKITLAVLHCLNTDVKNMYIFLFKIVTIFRHNKIVVIAFKALFLHKTLTI